MASVSWRILIILDFLIPMLTISSSALWKVWLFISGPSMNPYLIFLLHLSLHITFLMIIFFFLFKNLYLSLRVLVNDPVCPLKSENSGAIHRVSWYSHAMTSEPQSQKPCCQTEEVAPMSPCSERSLRTSWLEHPSNNVYFYTWKFQKFSDLFKPEDFTKLDCLYLFLTML